MTPPARHLGQNLRIGARAVFLRPLQGQGLHADADQLVLLLLLSTAVGFAGDWLVSQPHPRFNTWAVPLFGASAASLLLAAHVAARSLGRPSTLGIAVTIVALWPVLEAMSYTYQLIRDTAAATTLPAWLAFGGFTLWYFGAVVRALRTWGGITPRQTARVVAALVVFSWLPNLWLSDSSRFWYPGQATRTPDPYAAYRDLDAEALFYRQPQMVENALAQIEPGRPGISDLYFIGFAGYARENVFRKEVEFARDLFDQSFDSRGRSLVFINHLDTRDRVPLANGSNLRLALRTLGQRMDTEEDVLVLFMTSHGSRKRGLDVDFWPLRLNDIAPADLRGYLDDAGIKWRVILVSSCYSGAFVEPLRDPNTLIATASAGDRTSFGCANDRDFTYFGEALLRDQLTRTHALLDALAAASESIGRREQREGLDPSRPQIVVGEAIAAKLNELQRRLDGLTENRGHTTF